MEKYVELKIHDMSTTLYPADAYALVLEEVGGNRKIPVIIGHLEAQAIKVMMVKYHAPRPLTHDLRGVCPAVGGGIADGAHLQGEGRGVLFLSLFREGGRGNQD